MTDTATIAETLRADGLAERYAHLVKTARAYAQQELRGAPTSTFEIMVGHFADFQTEIRALLDERDRLTAECQYSMREIAAGRARAEKAERERDEARADHQLLARQRKAQDDHDTNLIEQLTARAEAAEAKLAEVTKERDEARADAQRLEHDVKSAGSLRSRLEAMRAGKNEQRRARIAAEAELKREREACADLLYRKSDQLGGEAGCALDARARQESER